MAKFGLGKGFDALLDDDGFNDSPRTARASSGNEEIQVDIDQLKPNPYQPRKEFSDEALQELADSIRLHGIIQPVVAEDCGDGTYFIIAGERRTRAAKLAGLKKVPVILRKFSDEHKLEVALIENIQRENLNPVEEARAYQHIMQIENISQEEAAKRVGKNRSTVANALRLLKLPEDMQNALAAGKISAGHARALLSVSDAADMRLMFARMMGSGMSVREAEQYAAELNAAEPEPKKISSVKKPSPAKDPDIASIEQQFIEALGIKVALKGSLESGTLEISYFSQKDLDRIYSVIVKS